MSEWDNATLDELASNPVTYGVVKPGEYDDDGVKLVRGGDIFHGKIKHNLRTITDAVSKQYQRTILQGGELIVSLVGNPGEVALVPDELIGANLARQVGLVRLSEQVYNEYTLYYLMSPAGIEQLKSKIMGSVQQVINLSDLRDVEICFPSFPEQKAIASVLSSLDDKIDLLHRQNKTLEAMAETLFRQWFVEEAQDDWEDGCLGDVIELLYGKGLKQEIRTGTGCPVVGSSGVVGYHSEYLVKAPGIVIGRKGTLGKVIYMSDNFYPIDTTYYIKSKVESAGLLYEYFLLKTLNFEEMNSDSAVPGLNREIALSTEIKIAPLERLQDFNQFVSVFIAKMNKNKAQIHTLEKLRDTLLPKLMSGEVTVDS